MSIERPSELVLIRHGESVRNAAKKGSTYFADDTARATVRGVPDNLIRLTELGCMQAIETGIGMRANFSVPEYVYHSGYARAEETTQKILGVYSALARQEIRVRVAPFIRERDPGYAYDMTTEEAERAFPWLHEHWQTFGGFFARPPGGESIADVTQRVYTFLNMLFRDRAGRRVWAVTHGGTIRAFRFLLEHWTYDQALRWPEGQSPENCGVTHYVFDEKQQRMVLRSYNDIYWS